MTMYTISNATSCSGTENDTEHEMYLYIYTYMIRAECVLELYTLLSENFSKVSLTEGEYHLAYIGKENCYLQFTVFS